jgi:hypothetical protein
MRIDPVDPPSPGRGLAARRYFPCDGEPDYDDMMPSGCFCDDGGPCDGSCDLDALEEDEPDEPEVVDPPEGWFDDCEPGRRRVDLERLFDREPSEPDYFYQEPDGFPEPSWL